MKDSSGRPEPLDFEKPIAELEGELNDPFCYFLDRQKSTRRYTKILLELGPLDWSSPDPSPTWDICFRGAAVRLDCLIGFFPGLVDLFMCSMRPFSWRH